MTAEEIEIALCGVSKPTKRLGSRGLHVWDLLKGNKFKTSNKGGRGCQPHVTEFPFVLGLAMRLHGDGAKAVGKKLGKPWQTYQNIVAGLGLRPLTMKESRNTYPHSLSDEEKAKRLYEETSMLSVKETQKDITWAKHPAYLSWYAMKRYYEKNPQRPVFLTESERLKRKKESIRRCRKRHSQNPIYRIKHGLRKRLRKKLNGKPSRTNAVTGCTTVELRQWLESQFKGSMSWDNYGTVWHVDHIRPCASFDVSVKADRIAMNHYTNLQPMWAKTNMKKSDQWDGQQEFTHELF